MAGSVRVGGQVGDDFAALARDLRQAGAKGLQKELYAGLQRAGRPMKPAVLASARETLPSGGGRGRRRTRLADTGETLTNAVSGRTHKIKVRKKVGSMKPPESVADRVAGASYSLKVSNRGRGAASIRFTGTAKRGKQIDLTSLDEGELRHMTFGRGQTRQGKSLWFTQHVPEGWFTRPLQGQADGVRREIERAVNVVEQQISRG